MSLVSRRADLCRTLSEVADGPLIGIGGRLATPPLPHHRAYGAVHGGSTKLCFNGNVESGETECVEVTSAQGLLDRRVA